MGFVGAWPQNINISAVANQMRIGLNSFTGDLSTTIGAVAIFNIRLNSFTEFSNFQFISTNLANIAADINNLDQTSVDGLFAALNTYFSTHTPIKNFNITIDGGTNASPTGGSSNTDIVNLRDVIYPAAGFTFSATIN
jgi:hypothetical protein